MVLLDGITLSKLEIISALGRPYILYRRTYVVVLISRDWILRLVPNIRGDWDIARNFAKNLTVLSFGEL